MNRESTAFDEDVATAYEAWYDTPKGKRADALEKAALYRLLQRFSDAHSVLEVGSGTGHFTRWLDSKGLAAVGVDLSTAMLKQARTPDASIWVQGDAHRLPFGEGAFDLVAFITTLEFLSRPDEALREGMRVARQGLLLGVLNRWSPLGIWRRLEALFQASIYRQAHFYNINELKRLLRSVAGTHSQIVWETTLRPVGWPNWIPNGRCGGFVAMALLELREHQ
ncbi:MAG: class I SAM-dependent methyltransferase [Anaerolineae bacterium]